MHKITTFATAKARGVAQLVRVLVWGARGRTFESSHPDYRKVLNATQKGNYNRLSFFFKKITPNFNTNRIPPYASFSMRKLSSASKQPTVQY